MPTHMSIRLAWHLDGWNGSVCSEPDANAHCVGCYSYPGSMIAEQRDLAWERENAGKPCASLPQMPPCVYSVNAFGKDSIRAYADPPRFFKDDTRRREWDLPPATVCTWPYEPMYEDDVKRPKGGYDYDLRLKKAQAYFGPLEPNKTLVFYYANYSNPLSEEESRRYVIVGVSRLKKLGEIMFYENSSERVRERYAGGFVWQRAVSSHYPDEGFRIPYHVYATQPEILEQIACIPEQPRVCKYATRHMSDDDALVVIERMAEAVSTLRELGDTTEDWEERQRWLASVMAELWTSRGLLPGLPSILDHLGLHQAIGPFRDAVLKGHEQAAAEEVFAFLEGKSDGLLGVELESSAAKKLRRSWKLKEEPERSLLREVLPRFDVSRKQIENILSPEREQNSVFADLVEIAVNPYVLSEQYVGDDVDDAISFSRLDHGVLPSPDLGGKVLLERDGWERLRALCVARLRAEGTHCFVANASVLQSINHRLNQLPEWKRHQYTERYLEVDEEELSAALTFRTEGATGFMYLREVYEDERLVEQTLRSLVGRPGIELRKPVTREHWKNWLHEPASTLAQKNPSEYDAVIETQAAACEQLFRRALCVLSGAAGTGKTTVIRSLMQAIDQAHGTGSPIRLLAPTGKAADRLRERTGRPASTIHSFLAEHGWLNPNMTFKRRKGTRDERHTTYIVDEASMIELGMLATLVRAINWNTVQRFILVGDPNQLPPIGRGRMFKDLIDWLGVTSPESLGTLTENFRQMANRLTKLGTGILDLAGLYVQESLHEEKDEGPGIEAEALLQRVQVGGEIDRDLRVIYWNTAEQLAESVTETITQDMEAKTGADRNPERPFELWGLAYAGDEDNSFRPEWLQVISPYRGEEFGTESMNLILQEHRTGKRLGQMSHIDGIVPFDKVIQIRNRPRSNPIWAYNWQTRQSEPVEIFNGEIGFSKPHPFDKNPWKWQNNLEHFQVQFARKQHLGVGYGRNLGRKPNGDWLSKEPVEGNLELAYAISVHKAQGSEFDEVYFVVPKHKAALLCSELFYTGLTRASRRCTLFIEEDVSPLLSMRRRERSHLARINSSLFEFRPVPTPLLELGAWYEEGTIHQALTGDMVRSKSEVIIANMLFERDVPFEYEQPLFAPDGTFYLPDFTIAVRGEKRYWEHLGRMDLPKYRAHWETKQAWYHRHFPGRLVTTTESPKLSREAARIVETLSQ